jgi:hypothetical protein
MKIYMVSPSHPTRSQLSVESDYGKTERQGATLSLVTYQQKFQ